MELKEIKVSDILANFYQPRTKFDKEKIKELAESILSNGLINPITITPDKKRQGKYMIVSGERRWQAHKVAKLNTIQTFIKEYSTDGQFMVESLIENLHREDLTPTEKGKFCLKIMKEEGIKGVGELSKRIKSNEDEISRWIDDYNYRKQTSDHGRKSSTTLVRATRGLDVPEREKIIKLAEKKGIGMHEKTLGVLFDVEEMRKSVGPTFSNKVSQSVIQETSGLPKERRIELIKQSAQEDFGSREMRKRVSEIKSGERPEPVDLDKYERNLRVLVHD